jgi:hypothetical protein
MIDLNKLWFTVIDDIDIEWINENISGLKF